MSCSLPGLLALGAKLLDPDYPWPHASSSETPIPHPSHNVALKKKLELHMLAAQGLATTCFALYEETKTGLGPQEVRFDAPPPPSAARPGVQQGPMGRWRESVKEWEEKGRKGVLVGTSRSGWRLDLNYDKEEEERGQDAKGRKKDYSIENGEYHLAPQVRVFMSSSLEVDR